MLSDGLKNRNLTGKQHQAKNLVTETLIILCYMHPINKCISIQKMCLLYIKKWNKFIFAYSCRCNRRARFATSNPSSIWWPEDSILWSWFGRIPSLWFAWRSWYQVTLQVTLPEFHEHSCSYKRFLFLKNIDIWDSKLNRKSSFISTYKVGYKSSSTFQGRPNPISIWSFCWR